MSKYKVLLLDVDGVLIIPPKTFSEQYCEKYAVDQAEQVKFYSSEEFKLSSIGKFDLRDALKIHKDLWQWQGSPEELMEMWFEGENYPNEPLLELVAKLRSSGVHVYLATQQEKYRRDWIMDVVFKDMFDGIFCSCDIGYNKRDDKFWEVVIEQLAVLHPGIMPAEIAYFDDMQTLVDKAREFSIEAYEYKQMPDVQTVLQ
jgi:putative hydrolase of the HAD superfamily